MTNPFRWIADKFWEFNAKIIARDILYQNYLKEQRIQEMQEAIRREKKEAP